MAVATSSSLSESFISVVPASVDDTSLEKETVDSMDIPKEDAMDRNGDGNAEVGLGDSTAMAVEETGVPSQTSKEDDQSVI